MSRAFAALQKALPQHALSRLTGRAADSTTPWLKNALIRAFVQFYPVNMSEAERERATDYPSFNSFFTRALKADARSLPADPRAAVSPADGALSQAGLIHRGQLLQAKGHSYSAASLVGEDCPSLDGGAYLTVYLAPHDYHRVHAPVAGELVQTRAIPGELLSVNASTETAIPGLFARNERLVCEFVTDHGRVFVVLVGALIVASIETVWAGPASPYQEVAVTRYGGPEHRFERGAEIGRFLAGSTVIVCFEKGRAELAAQAQPGQIVKMGQELARLH